jgi:hypothetical protein
MKEKTQKTSNLSHAEVAIATFQTGQDVKTAVLIVSLLVNVTVFTVWLVLQLTPRYDAVMTTWLLG